MDDCIFCKIMKGEIPSTKFYEDELMFIIADIAPRAKKHYKLITEMTEADAANLSKMITKIGELAPGLGLDNGYRLIINQGDDARQTVHHLHIHIMGGELLGIENGKRNA